MPSEGPEKRTSSTPWDSPALKNPDHHQTATHTNFPLFLSKFVGGHVGRLAGPISSCFCILGKKWIVATLALAFQDGSMLTWVL